MATGERPTPRWPSLHQVAQPRRLCQVLKDWTDSVAGGRNPPPARSHWTRSPVPLTRRYPAHPGPLHGAVPALPGQPGFWARAEQTRKHSPAWRVPGGGSWEGHCPSLEVITHLPFSPCQGQESASPAAEPTSATADRAGIAAAPRMLRMPQRLSPCGGAAGRLPGKGRRELPL